MWSAISKFFSKPESNCEEQSGEDPICGVGMDRTDDRRPDMDLQDTYDTRQAKQRASVKWLLSKAFNNKVPENLREPFYRDHENQEHLKPQIVRSLANAEFYCLALGNIYSDPNYHNLNHWTILQTLARKGIYVNEPPDAQLTETVLIQTNPLRMSAHMAVIESTMVLYAKEVVTADRVLAAVQRFNFSGSAPMSETGMITPPQDHEQGLLLWVSHACSALRKRVGQEIEQTTGAESDRPHPPDLPPVKDLKDLCDGVGLAALISFYCPDELPWTQLLVSYLPTVSESLHNLMLVYNFCERSLPFSVFHMMPEDVTYMRGSMKQNLVVFLADMFNVLEIHPVKCVRYPGMDKSNSVTRSSPPVHMTVRKTQSLQQSVSEFSEDSLRRGSEDSFVVHRGRGVPTLSSVLQAEEPLLPARLRPAKEKSNNDTKADERGDGRPSTAAGKPSNWDETRKTTYAGRRSRRNSTSDDSQLTIENFGGSQEHLNFIGRNPDKDVAVHIGRKISAPAPPIPFENNVAIRSSIQDARGSIQIGYDSDSEKQDHEKDSYKLKRQLSSDAIPINNIVHSKASSDLLNDIVDGEVSSKMASFADLSKQKVLGDPKGIQIVYMNYDKEDNAMPSKSSFLNKKPGNGNTNGEKKTTTFATLPNTTTWQQQSSNVQQQLDNHGEDSPGHNVMASQLNDIRMKLEEKRRHIENEKRKMEIVVNKQRQKVGKAAFLQAVTKGKGNLVKTPTDSESSSATGSEPRSPGSEASIKPQRPFTLQEISEDAMTVEHKWLDQDGSAPFVETRKTPDIESMDMEQYQQSIAQMNSSLHDIQADIQRLASQQNQIQASQQHVLLAEQHKAHMQALAAAQAQQQQLHQQMVMHQQSQQPQSHFASPTPQAHYNPMQSYGSVPHLPQYPQMSTSPRMAVDQPQFYLHDQPTPPQRRTWAQPAPAEPPYPQPELRTWGKPQNNSSSGSSGFMLHDSPDMRYQNGEHGYHNNHVSYTLSQQHQQHQQQHQNPHQHQQAASLFPGSGANTPPTSASPQHRNVHRQISQLMNDSDSSKRNSPVNLSQLNEPPYEKARNMSGIIHAPIPTPPVDDMEPQNISFIGNADDAISQNISKLNITSGTRTYRIPSPTRPAISRTAFQQQPQPPPEVDQIPDVSALDTSEQSTEKGFYISFDNEQPKRPKPPLRMKRNSPKKERSVSAYVENNSDEFGLQSYVENVRLEQTARERRRQLERELEEEKRRQEEREVERQRQERLEKERAKLVEKRDMSMRETSQEREAAAAIIIGNDLMHPDPNSLDEMEKKKERIMLLSLQRRQQQEELKERKEAETHARREREKAKDEERQRKKEEQAARRAAILEQHKLKKAIEEAEREGKVLDESKLMGSLKPAPKMRSKTTLSRPRPKTIHVDSGSVEMAEGMLQPSQGKKGSTTNLIANSYTPTCSSTMRRDYYRGSHDSLADRGMGSGLLYRDSPDDSRGMSPCRSTNPSLGRRSSYKTSREVQEPGQIRGRPKYQTYQNFKGRKSNSLMNLCGSSSDQDSMAYRYGDTDSGLGRATPPRRAPSPGMGPMRHLPSPSGPGSLPPGLMTKRRIFDDGSSDISSTPSSMMDYTGAHRPRLYKQPATKSNRGIMLNAVEYCVFPGVVNKEAKQRVLEEIARSESKHFLILFRDAGCQFRALYSYCPDREEVLKLYGTGPKLVNDRMFDKFFKYNSGGKCFSQIHTKHLTVTIDAFTIHNSLWQGKKVNLPNKKDMALVI